MGACGAGDRGDMNLLGIWHEPKIKKKFLIFAYTAYTGV